MIKEISVVSTKRNELLDITTQVESAVKESGVREGFCIVYAPHTTAALTINENADPGVKADILRGLSRLVPEDAAYSHAEGNSDAHIKSSIVGCSQLIPIRNRALLLGKWQGIMLAEFDGPRTRKVIVTIL